MANSESLRYFQIGRESTVGTLAATMKAYPFVSLDYTPKVNILQPKEFRGVRAQQFTGLLGTQMSTVKAKVYGYYDLLGWILAAAFNAPTDAVNDTSAFDHTFKLGAGSVPSNSLQFAWGIGTAANEWTQVTGAFVDQIDFSFTADKLMEVDVTWVAALGSPHIAAPSISTFSIASYVHPFSPPTQSVKINGSGFAKLISGKVSVKNSRSPLYTINSTADPARFIEGMVEVSLDLEVDYQGYASSLFSNYITNALPGTVVLQAQDTTHLIGAATAFPTFSLTTVNARLTAGQPKADSKGNTTVSIKGSAEYDTASSSLTTALLTNVVASYPGS